MRPVHVITCLRLYNCISDFFIQLCLSHDYLCVSASLFLSQLGLYNYVSQVYFRLRQVYFCDSDRVSLSQTGLFPCLRHCSFRVLSPVYFCVSDIIISVSQPGLFLCLRHIVISVSPPDLFQGYLCVSDRGISVSQTGLFLCLRQGYLCGRCFTCGMTVS